MRQSGREITDEKRALILDTYIRLGKHIRKTAEELGIDRGTVSKYIRLSDSETETTVATDQPSGPKQSDQGDTPIVKTGDGNTQTVSFTTRKRIRTEQDAVEAAGVDTEIWRVKKWEVTSWEVGMKLRRFSEDGKHAVIAEEPYVEPLVRVWLQMERIIPWSHETALRLLLEGLSRRTPAGPTRVRHSTGRDQCMMVVDCHDVHFGKLAWAAESGQDQDVAITTNLYRNAVTDLLRMASGFPLSHFVMPIGSDLLHIDGMANQTTAGTPVDCDTRAPKVFSAAMLASIWGIEALSDRGTVYVPYLPGNHDYMLSYAMTHVIGAYFRNNPNVVVDLSPKSRKYHAYGDTLIGLAHGAYECFAKLPGLMASEVPEMFAAAKCREWHTGHLHKAKKLVSLALDSDMAVTVRVLRSLSAVDAWHYRHGFVGGAQAMEAYVYDRGGFVASFNANARLD